MCARDRGTCLSRVGETVQTGAVAFTTTHWSVVLTAQGQSPVADEALEKLCRLYWWPLYGSVRRRAMLLRKHKILLRGSSRCCWREEIWMRCAGKGSITCLSSRFTQKFPRQGASARDGRQTWRGKTACSVGRASRARARRPRTSVRADRQSNL